MTTIIFPINVSFELFSNGKEYKMAKKCKTWLLQKSIIWVMLVFEQV